MIVEVYRDAGTILKDGVEIPYVNEAEEWWVKFSTGSVRPATETELELWQGWQAQKTQDDHQIREANGLLAELRKQIAELQDECSNLRKQRDDYQDMIPE